MGVFTEFAANLREQNSNVRWFMFCVFINGFIMSSLSVMLGIYYKNIGLTEASIGSLLSIRTLGTSIGALLAILLVQSFGTRKGLTISFIAMVISGLLFINVRYIPVMQLASLIFGMSQSVINVVQAPFYKKNSTDDTVVGTFSCSFVLGNCAMFLGSFLFGGLSDFFALFGGAAFGSQTALNISIAFLCIAPFALTRIDFMEEPNQQPGRLKELFGFFQGLSLDAWLYLAKVACIGVGAGLIIPFFSVYIKYSLGVTDSVVGSIMAFAQFGTVLGGLVVPSLSRRIGRVRMVILCQLLSIPFLFSISFPQGAYMMALSFFFRNTFMNMANPILQSLAMDLVEEKNRTVMSSVFSLTDNIFRAVSTQAGGYLMMAVSYNFPYYLTMLFYGISTLIVYFVFGRKEQYRNLR